MFSSSEEKLLQSKRVRVETVWLVPVLKSDACGVGGCVLGAVVEKVG